MVDTDVTSDVEENDSLIAQLMGELEEAPEPGSAKIGAVEHRGNDEIPMPVVQTQLSSAGYVYIYDRYTGDRSVTNRNMLPTQLRKRYIDGPHKGELVFVKDDPKIVSKRNRLKCRLHADDEDRAEWDEMGFPVCTKSNLVSRYHQARHMQSKHRDEWAAIQELAYQRESEDDKEFKRTLMEIASRTGVAPVMNLDAPKRRTKNPNRVAAGRRTAAKLAATAGAA